MASLGSVGEWHDTADVVVAGLGLAGAATAIHALELEPALDVLILEKMNEAQSGGNSRVSGQTLFLPRDSAKALGYQRALNATNPVPDVWLRAWAEEMVQLEPWVRRMAAEAGLRFNQTWADDPAPLFRVCEYPEMPDSDAVEFIGTLSDRDDAVLTPSSLWEAFRRCLAKRPVRKAFGQRVCSLVQDPDTGEVFGVQVRSATGQWRNLRARRGVVLATGGYENDDAMLRSYVGLDGAVPLGSPGNTGDGVRMLQRAGAEMRGFTQHTTLGGGVWPAIRVPGQPTAFMRQLFWNAWSWIDVAEDSSRFIDESLDYRAMHYKVKRHGVWRDTEYSRAGTMHMVFDDAVRRSQKLVVDLMTWSALVGDYRWSDDNSAEVASGLITTADSIPELARRIGRDPDALGATVARYNRMARDGRDTDFGRAAASMRPIESGPYHALRVLPGVICTAGGAVRDANSQVISVEGKPIPRLHSAGELGSIQTGLYQLGGYLTECMVSGRAAARALAGTHPWC